MSSTMQKTCAGNNRVRTLFQVGAAARTVEYAPQPQTIAVEDSELVSDPPPENITASLFFIHFPADSQRMPFQMAQLPSVLERQPYGSVRIRGRRIELYMILEAAEQGISTAEIQRRYRLDRQTVEAAIEFGRQHPEAAAEYVKGSKRARNAMPAPTLAELQNRAKP